MSDEKWITAEVRSSEPPPLYRVECECGYRYEGDHAEIPASCLWPLPHRVSVFYFDYTGSANATVDFGTTTTLEEKR